MLSEDFNDLRLNSAPLLNLMNKLSCFDHSTVCARTDQCRPQPLGDSLFTCSEDWVHVLTRTLLSHTEAHAPTSSHMHREYKNHQENGIYVSSCWSELSIKAPRRREERSVDTQWHTITQYFTHKITYMYIWLYVLLPILNRCKPTLLKSCMPQRRNILAQQLIDEVPTTSGGVHTPAAGGFAKDSIDVMKEICVYICIYSYIWKNHIFAYMWRKEKHVCVHMWRKDCSDCIVQTMWSLYFQCTLYSICCRPHLSRPMVRLAK